MVHLDEIDEAQKQSRKKNHNLQKNIARGQSQIFKEINIQLIYKISYLCIEMSKELPEIYFERTR